MDYSKDDMYIHNLFPTAIGSSVRYLTNNEKQFFEELKQTDRIQNAGNTYTRNIHVLDDAKLKDLKTDLTDIVNNYFQKVVQPRAGIEVYITISWVNYTEKGQWHHEHSHPNSILSGVYYIDADETDKISFTNTNYLPFTLDIQATNYNEWNSKSWWLSTPPNNVFIFPSSLVHRVEPTTNENTRVSLAFNTFVKGYLAGGLTDLHLNG